MKEFECQASVAETGEAVSAEGPLQSSDSADASDWKIRAKALSDAAWLAVQEASEGCSFVDTSTPVGKLSEMVLEMAVHLGQAGRVIHDLERSEEADYEVERILALSDEEVLAEVRAAGGDPEAIAKRMRRLFSTVLQQKTEPRPCPFCGSSPEVGDELLRMLTAANHALKSYQYGNSSTELAAEMCAAIDPVIAKAKGEPS